VIQYGIRGSVQLEFIPDEEVIALLREVRDLLAAEEEKLERHLEKVRQLYADQLREANRMHWRNIVLGYSCLFLSVAFGVFVGLMVGLRLSRP
jgi:hypothetical protein